MIGEQSNDKSALRKLYPGLTAGELATAEENLHRYFSVVLRICARIRSDPAAYARFKALTASRQRP